MATLFPRGKQEKGPSSGPKKGKRKVESGDRLFIERNESTTEHDKKRRKRKFGDHEDETLKEFDQSEVREMLHKESSLKVEYFHLANVQEGMLLFGCVREIRGLQLSISLPHCQNGQVQANQISVEYTELIKAHINSDGDVDQLATLDEMFEIGDFVVCSVLKRDDSRIIPLTLCPSIVNKYLSSNDLFVGKSITGSVKSEEDHGYVINIGNAHISAFLPIKECGQKRFEVGSVIRTAITDIRGGGKIIILSISKKLLESSVKDKDVASLDTLQPGTVGVFIPSIVDTVGMIGKFLGFNASITALDYDATSSKNSSEDGEGEMSAKKKKLPVIRQKNKSIIPAESENLKELKCCVLYVNPLTKHIVLCANTLVLDSDARHKFLSDKLFELPQGMKCKVELTKTIHGLGAIFQLNCGLKGFSHLKNLSDSKFVDFSQTFGEIKKFDARIIQNPTVDGVIEVCLKKSIVENEFYTYDNILPGTLVECTIEAFKDKGVWVRIGKTKISPIKGFLNNIHLADVILKHPDRVFSVGDVITCRVLNVDKNRERVRVTHKKTLIKSKLPIITEYEQLKENMIVHAYIISIKDFGVFIELYNNVRGFVPKSDLAVEFIDDPLKTFYVGQIVKCRVVFCRLEEEKARFSLILKPKETRDRLLCEKEEVQDVKVTGKTDDGFHVVSCKGKGFLPKMHLSDFPSIAKGWFNVISEGDTIDGCLLVNAKLNMFTRKNSIIRCHVDPTSKCKDLLFGDLEEGLLSVGFVYKHEDFGIFVQLPGGLVGLCPKSKMADKYLLNSRGYFLDGQTVVCKVLQIDKDKKRFILSLKESDCDKFTDSKFGFSIDIYAEEFSNIMKLLNSQWDHGLGVGKIYNVTILGNDHKDGFLCTNEQFPEGFASVLLDDVPNVDNIKDKKVDAVMLQIDLLSKMILLSANTSLYNVAKQYKSGSVLSCSVKFINEDVATVFSQSDSKQAIAVTMARSSHIQSFLQQNNMSLNVGDVMKAAVVHSDYGCLYVAKIGKKDEPTVGKEDVTAKVMKEFGINGDPKFGNLKVGQTVKGVIKSVRATHLLVRIAKDETDGNFRGNPITGRLHYSELQDELLESHFSMKEYQCWSEISSKVSGFRDVKTHRFLAITNRRNSKRCVLELSMREEHVNLKLNMLKVGDEVTTYFKKYLKEDKEMLVEVTPSVKGFVPVLLLSAEPLSTLKSTKNCYKPYAARCVVHKIFSSKFLFAVKGALVDKNTQQDVNVVNTGCVTNGRIQRIFENKMVVKLPDGVVGTVHRTDSSDDFSEDVFKGLKVNDIVRCFVLECIDRENAVLSMRKSHLLPESTPPEVKDPAFNDGKELSAGMKLRGFISGVAKCGLFVTLSRTVTARALLTGVSKYFIKDLNKVGDVFKIGRLVTCKVLSVTEIEGRVSVSLLESDTGLPDLVPESLKLPLRTGQKAKRKQVRLVDKIEGRKSRILKAGEKMKSKDRDGKKRKKSGKEDVDSGVDEEMATGESHGMCKITITNPEIDANDPGFSWEPIKTTKGVLDDTSSDEEEEEVAPPRKKTKLEIKLEEKQREEKIRQEEERLLENSTPRTAEEWDKLVISTPQNSFVWVSYMTFHLLSNEIERARTVAERALKTIDFSEERERWNIWASLLNLENKFGKEGSLVNTIGRACQHNDPLKVNLHMVSLYERSGKMKAAEELCEKMTKKFRQNKTVWMLYISHLMQRGIRKQADEVFKRSLQSLEKNIHLEVISKFAQLEYKYGDPEHGRVLFENALASYPRRADIWSIYIDMLIKSSLTIDARDVLERVTTMNFSTKNMKSFFKKYLEFETNFGNEKLVIEVKQKALEYIQLKTELED